MKSHVSVVPLAAMSRLHKQQDRIIVGRSLRAVDLKYDNQKINKNINAYKYTHNNVKKNDTSNPLDVFFCRLNTTRGVRNRYFKNTYIVRCNSYM